MIGRIIAALAGRVIALLVTLRMARRPGLTALRGTARGAAEPPAGGDGAPAEEDPSRRVVPRSPRAERIVAGLLGLGAVSGFAFTAVYVFDGLNDQLLGLALGAMFALLGAAAIVAGKAVVPQETAVQERDTLLDPEAPEALTAMIASGAEGVSRRWLLAGAAGVAGTAATTAVVTPLASLGPRLGAIHQTPWERGVRMVDEQAVPLRAADVEVGSLLTALPEGRDWELLGSGLVVVRLPERLIDLPPGRAGWAPGGILAFSKTCPHAACAISLYRYPQFPSAGNLEPALTCPCHYSTFLPGQGGRLLFGPAGRPLPQLPVMIDPQGFLRAAGGFDEDVGPSWLDVRTPRRS